MKKIYLSILSLAVAVGANAQQTQLVTKIGGNAHNSTANQTKPVVNTEKAAVLWSDDFSVPGNWAMTNTSAPTSYDWVITTDPLAIPQSGIAASLMPFSSTTAANGYALINSDGQPGNADGDGAIVAEITNVTPIDLSSSPNVVLTFQHSYRWWQDTRGVRVSGDNGSTWTDYDITSLAGGVSASGYPNNQDSENPVVEVINISAVAGGQSQVLIQFYYNDNDIWAWYWTVDDVEILEQPTDDIQLLSSWFSGTNNGGIEYGRTPSNHLDASYLVGGEIYNFGVNDQTNIVLDADYTTFTAQSTYALLESDSTVYLESTETPALPVGSYSGTYTAVSDDETGGAEFGNNVYPRNFDVTVDEYSIDGLGGINPAATETLGSIGTGSFAGGEDGLVVAALYNIKQTDNVMGIRVMLDAATVEGGDIYGSVLDTSDFWANTITPLYNTTPGSVTAADVSNGYIDLYFPSTVSLTTGAYYAGVELYSNTNANDIVIIDDQTVAQPGVASAIYIPGDQSYTNGTGIGVRMLMGTVGIDENALEGVSIYPNPSEGLVNVSNDNNVENTIIVHDLSGRLITTTTATAATTIDLSANGTGVYTVTVSNENGSVVERVIIK